MQSKILKGIMDADSMSSKEGLRYFRIGYLHAYYSDGEAKNPYAGKDKQKREWWDLGRGIWDEVLRVRHSLKASAIYEDELVALEQWTLERIALILTKTGDVCVEDMMESADTAAPRPESLRGPVNIKVAKV